MVNVTYLQKNECYPCSRREAKATFGDMGLKWIGLGWPLRQFESDSRGTHRPNIGGEVVAEVAYSPEREGWFCAYAIRKEKYPEEAKVDFRDRVLPRLREWLARQMTKPDTAVLGYDHVIVEWDGKTHKLHEWTLKLK